MIYLAGDIHKEYFEFWKDSLSIKLPIDYTLLERQTKQ